MKNHWKCQKTAKCQIYILHSMSWANNILNLKNIDNKEERKVELFGHTESILAVWAFREYFVSFIK